MRRLVSLALVLLLAAVLVHGCDAQSEKDYFAEADRLFEKGRGQEAVSVYKEYLEKFPKGKKRDQAFFNCGRILYYNIGDKAEAVKLFSNLVNQYPGSEYAYESRIIMAEAFQKETRDYNQALLEYKWLLEQRPDDERADDFQYEAARCYLLSGQTEQAILEFARFLDEHPGSDLVPNVYDELGGAYMYLNRPEPALFIFSTILDKYPDSQVRLAAEFKIGHALEELYRYKEALKVYEGLLDRYYNRQAVEVRIAGVKERQKNKLGKAADVDYSFRPDVNPETLKNFKDKDEAAAGVDNLKVKTRKKKK